MFAISKTKNPRPAQGHQRRAAFESLEPRAMMDGGGLAVVANVCGEEQVEAAPALYGTMRPGADGNVRTSGSLSPGSSEGVGSEDVPEEIVDLFVQLGRCQDRQGNHEARSVPLDDDAKGGSAMGILDRILSGPIPVWPYVPDLAEEKSQEHERLPISGPDAPLDPPSEDEIMRALEDGRPVGGDVPALLQQQPHNVQIVTERADDDVAPPRLVPPIDPRGLHHAHYKVAIYYSGALGTDWTQPYATQDEDAVEVIYIDHCHWHMVGNVDLGVDGNR